ncbi:tail fiber domain-containing protein [Dyadobacter arcticus]|uniref:Peptidase S74 domain-containing protein n=1 Tax=Dyadobacter arcticus TaxID=1078754 RepID=A0ABX0UG99_9BACT|nr:tail fiber domain-containing protein [Dyadobacter arcticus]NIJ52022.1 hypothetical protein [Dyadobacter arcticus]
MKKWHKTALVLMMIACSVEQMNAQGTQYGTGAGVGGQYRAFFGIDAGKVNTAKDNTFIGHQTGLANSAGASNTFVGSAAGLKNVAGNNNTFNGSYAGSSNDNGSENTFTGALAGFRNVSGVQNTFMGASAGIRNAQGSFNSFVGFEAGANNDDGKENAYFGSQSGRNSKFGLWNVFLGSKAGFNSDNSGANTFVGYESGYSSTGSQNTFIGTWAGKSNIKGDQNSSLGFSAGASNTSGRFNTYLGAWADGSPILENATAIGAFAKVTKDNCLVLGSSSAYVGIGISAPSYHLQLDYSDAAKLGSSTWTIWSDQRLKKDISDFTDGLDLLQQIKPVWFSYNGEAGIKTDKKFVGVIAQDMQKIAPYTVGSAVYQDSLGNKTEYLDYDANAVTYLLINSVKEQQVIIEQKEAKIQEVSAQVNELTKRLAQLERIVATGSPKSLNGNAAARQDGEPNENGVILLQNAPNGFSQKTSIKYFIPQSVKEALVNIYSVDGVKVNSYPVSQRGEGALEISATEFRSGVFVYDLITDGKSNGAKKMVVK